MKTVYKSLMAHNKLAKQLLYFENNREKLWNENNMFKDLFEKNDYTQIQEMLNIAFKITDKNLILKELRKIENETATALNNFNGKIHIKIDKELSKSLMNDMANRVSINNFNYLPFKCFQIDLSHFQGVENALIYKKNEVLYCSFHGVGKEKISLQIVLSNDGLYPKYTYSSLFYIQEISPLLTEVKELERECFSYVVSLLKYMIDNNNDEDIVVRNMEFDKLNNKLSNKQKSKPKNVKKLASKSNTITLKFNANRVKYINSVPRRRKNKKITKEIVVKGYWKNVAIGKRGEGKTYKKWINSHKKCVQDKPLNKMDYYQRIYQVS